VTSGPSSIDAGHHDLLGEDVPVGGRAFEAVEEPVALFVAEERALRVQEDGAGRFVAIALGLGRAVLAGVEDVEIGEPAEG
jgi:hypothetical protein